MGKLEKQIVRTKGREKEHMDVILQNRVEYKFNKAYTHVKGIGFGFTAHSSSFFPINAGF